MKKFWGFYDNGTYKVGCNGQTMYLYDSENCELARFRDITYGYEGAFQPHTNIFLLHSTTGRIAVYDCDERKLLRKFRFSDVDGAQDHGFCFSPDGRYFMNIECVKTSLRTRLSIYETQSFLPVKRLFEDDLSLVLDAIEYDRTTNRYAVLYFVRDNAGLFSRGYVGELKEDHIIDPQLLGEKAYDFLRSYKFLQTHGFTEKAMEWSPLRYAGYPMEEIMALRDRSYAMFSFPQIADEVVR